MIDLKLIDNQGLSDNAVKTQLNVIIGDVREEIRVRIIVKKCLGLRGIEGKENGRRLLMQIEPKKNFFLLFYVIFRFLIEFEFYFPS